MSVNTNIIVINESVDFFTIFIPTLTSLISGILLFYISKKVEKYWKRKHNLYYLKREFEYNINLINKYINNCKNLVKTIDGKHNKYTFFAFYKFQKTAFNNCLSYGYLYEKFNNRELKKLTDVMTSFTLEIGDSMNEGVKWIISKTNLKSARDYFNVRMNDMKKFKNQLIDFKKKI